MKSFAAGYERFARIVMMAFVVNVAFVLHTLLGLVVGGFFPSVAATYATFRTWVLSVERSWTFTQTWVCFQRAWKQEFVSANLFGWPQATVGALLVWDYYLANWNNMGVVGIAASGLLLLANVFFAVFTAVSWAVRSHFDERPWWVVRTSLRMVLARPLCTIVVAGILLATFGIWYTWPGVAVGFGVALPVFAIVITVAGFGRLPGFDTPRPETETTARRRTTLPTLVRTHS